MKLCSLHHLAGALWLDDPEHLPGFVRRHLEACPACRSRYGAECQLVEDLCTSAERGASHEPWPGSRRRQEAEAVVAEQYAPSSRLPRSDRDRGLRFMVPRHASGSVEAAHEPAVGCPPSRVPGTEPAEAGTPNVPDYFIVPRRAAGSAGVTPGAVGCPPFRVPGTEPAEAGTPNHADQSTLPNRSPAAGVGARHPPFPPFLKARILAQLEAGNGQRHGGSSGWISRIAPAFGFAAGLAFLGLVWLGWLESSSPPRALDTADTSASGDSSLRFALLEHSAADRLQRWSATLENPLANEMASAVADGQRLLASVVQSCVPEPTASAILQRTSDLVGRGTSATLPTP